jgi:probable phosphoglycerate mutase
VIRVLLLRHASGPHVGRLLAGRAPGTTLDAEGVAQAERLADYVATLGVTVLYASPLERALLTARPLARRLGVDVRESAAFTELDYGGRTGLAYDSLADDATWRHDSGVRSGTRIPEGETMLEAQVRAVAELLRWRDEHAGGCVAVVSHADIIRAVVAYALGMPLDLAHRLAVDPASVSEIELHDWGALVRRVNDTCAARPPDMG